MSEEYHTLIPVAEELRTDRILLRPFTPDDAPELQAAIAESREHLRPWLPFYDGHQTVDETRHWIITTQSAWLLHTDFSFGVWTHPNQRFLGGIGLHVRKWDIRYFEIGYWLRVSAVGNGYMTEAARLLADYAMTELEANRVEIRCDAQNTASQQVAKRAGFEYEGTHKNDHLTTSGEASSTMFFSRSP